MSNPASDIAKAAKQAFEASQLIPSSERINALNAIKHQLHATKYEILAANREDLQVHPLCLFGLCSLTRTKRDRQPRKMSQQAAC
jgi:gamma-glutamyl phosphate reductase